MDIVLSEGVQSITTEEIRTLAFSDWIDATREARPELSQRLDRIVPLAQERISIGLGTGGNLRDISVVDQEMERAIASVQEYLSEHPELLPMLIQKAREQMECNERDAQMAWECYQAELEEDVSTSY